MKKKILKTPRRTRSPRLSVRIFAFLIEMRWFFIGVAVLFLSVALWGFNKTDISWSRTGTITTIQNPAGFIGAWISDILLYTFGYSAWWLIGLFLIIIWRNIRHPGHNASWLSRSALGTGFVLLLFGSSTLESMRFYRFAGTLPSDAGGIVGTTLGSTFESLFGYSMSTIFLLLILAVGWHLFSRMSWMWLFENIGEFFEREPFIYVVTTIKNTVQKLFQRTEKTEDADNDGTPFSKNYKEADFYIGEHGEMLEETEKPAHNFAESAKSAFSNIKNAAAHLGSRFASSFTPEFASANETPINQRSERVAPTLNTFNSFKTPAPSFSNEAMESAATSDAAFTNNAAFESVDENEPQTFKSPLQPLFHWAGSFAAKTAGALAPTPAAPPPVSDLKISLPDDDKVSISLDEPPPILKPIASALELEETFTPPTPDEITLGIGPTSISQKAVKKTPPLYLFKEQRETTTENAETTASPFVILEEFKSVPTNPTPPAAEVEDVFEVPFPSLQTQSAATAAPASAAAPTVLEKPLFSPFPELEKPDVEKLPKVEESSLPIVEETPVPLNETPIEVTPLNLDEHTTEKKTRITLDNRFGDNFYNFTPAQHHKPAPAPAPAPTLTSYAQKDFSYIPSVELLDPVKNAGMTLDGNSLRVTSQLIEQRLKEFGVSVKVVNAISGPVVTRFEIEPAVGVKGAQVVNLAKDLARALAVISIRVVETIPGKSYMALELPNPKRQMVQLKDIICSRAFENSPSLLTVSLGKDIGGVPTIANLAKMPHLLVAGTTGSGKSVGVNAMILSILYKAEPSEVRLIMVDPKMLELSVYEGIPHLLTPVVTDMKQAANALSWCVAEMERRYKLMSAIGVRNIDGLNHKIIEAEMRAKPLNNPFSLTPESPEALEKLPYIVVIIDELADLMMVVGKKVEELIARLAQKARAAGIHLILATQRPSVDVITGLIKANIPTRIAFQVSSKIDSRTILEQMGAEALLGQGDMLYLAPGTGTPQRVHGAFVSDDEVHRVVDYLKSFGPPQYINEVLEVPQDESENSKGDADAESDPLYDQAVDVVTNAGRVSISLVQRHLRIGYNRAARIVEAMGRAGLLSEPDRRGNREVIVKQLMK